MTKEKTEQRTKEREQSVVTAIRNGANERSDIAYVTGLEYDVVCQCLRNLAAAHNAPSLGCLMKILAPAPRLSPAPTNVASLISRFTSHNCVIVDKALRPSLAADLLAQVLGKDYCTLLIDSLMVACVPGAVEDEAMIRDIPDANHV